MGFLELCNIPLHTLCGVGGDVAFFLSHSFFYVWAEISSIHKLGKLRNCLEKFQKNLLPEVFI